MNTAASVAPRGRAEAPTLIGVGVGPGDPDLVTLAALRALSDADAILVPSTEASAEDAGRAETIVRAVVPEASGRLVRVPFAMGERTGVGPRRAAAWDASAQAAADAFAAGASTVAFATVGDPSVYSTFSYLAASVRASVPGVTVRLIPGITAMQALAAASHTPLVEGRERLTLVPVTAGVAAVASALDAGDTVVAYKVGRHLPALRALASQRGRDGVLGVNVGLPNQELATLDASDDVTSPYFSTVLIPAVRTTTGGRL